MLYYKKSPDRYYTVGTEFILRTLDILSVFFFALCGAADNECRAREGYKHNGSRRAGVGNLAVAAGLIGLGLRRGDYRARGIGGIERLARIRRV